MPRQELANDVLLFNNYFERIADVRSPGGINQVNGNLMNGSENEWTVLKNSKDGFYAQIFNERFLLQKYGQYKGYPLRTFAGGKYDGGYSDHLPVYLYLVKKF